MQLLAIVLVALAGTILGLLGGGGSLVILPILIYVLRLPVHDALATSLLIVASASLLATFGHARAGNVNWRLGWATAAFSMSSSWLFAKLAQKIPSGVLLTGFALVMLATALFMLKSAFRKPETVCPNGETGLSSCTARLGLWPIAAAAGLLVGAFTGLVGAGGGFLLVPMLLWVAKLPMPMAIGTSLWIITLTAFASLLSYLPAVELERGLSTELVIAACAGGALGTLLAPMIPSAVLRKSFGVLVFILGSFLLAVRLG